MDHANNNFLMFIYVPTSESIFYTTTGCTSASKKIREAGLKRLEIQKR